MLVVHEENMLYFLFVMTLLQLGFNGTALLSKNSSKDFAFFSGLASFLTLVIIAYAIGAYSMTKYAP